MRIGTLFSGIGAPEQAAMRVYGDKLQHAFACEWDKYARESFNANYNVKEEHFYKDVNDMDGNNYKGEVDLVVGGSPCQAFSIAGLRKGTEDIRGQLIYQFIRIIDETKPPHFIYENVKGMMSIEKGETIKEFMTYLSHLGYAVTIDVVNSKWYDVPQNRERVFIVGQLLKDGEVRKNIKPTSEQINNKKCIELINYLIKNVVDFHYLYEYTYPKPIELKTRLKDVLENLVDAKYYMSDNACKYITNPQRLSKKFTSLNGEVSQTLMDQYSQSMAGTFLSVGDDVDMDKILEPTLQQVGTIKKEIIKRANETPVKINQFLKDNKKNFTLKQISDLSGISKTTIEHYFRTDKSRAIPNAKDWDILKNILNFDDSYDNLVKETISKISTFESTSRIYSDDLSPTLTCGEPSLHLVGTLDIKGNDSIKRVYSSDGLRPCLTTMGGGNREPKILEEDILNPLKGKTEFGWHFEQKVYDIESKCTRTLTASDGSGSREKVIENYRIRKLTPRECFRLQDFPDSFKFVVSNSQLYKQAGNSMTVRVVEFLMLQLERMKTESKEFEEEINYTIEEWM